MVTNGKNGNGSKKREFTAQKIIESLHKSHGLLTLAAKNAGIGYRTVCRYVEEYPSVAQAVVDAKDEMLDFAEGKLFAQISKNNMTAIIFYLKTQGKARGYIERQEFTGDKGEPLIPPAPPALIFHMADGTVMKPPANGHGDPAEIGQDGNGDKPSTA